MQSSRAFSPEVGVIENSQWSPRTWNSADVRQHLRATFKVGAELHDQSPHGRLWRLSSSSESRLSGLWMAVSLMRNEGCTTISAHFLGGSGGFGVWCAEAQADTRRKETL
jgi:hypothetical protein